MAWFENPGDVIIARANAVRPIASSIKRNYSRPTFIAAGEFIMRSKPLAIVLKSDIDLSHYSSRRVRIEAIGAGEFRVTSTLRFWSCERHNFVGRYIRRRAPQCVFYSGNASAPTGYFAKR